MEYLIDGATLIVALVLLWRNLRAEKTADVRRVAREHLRVEFTQNPNRTAKIAAYLREHPEIRSYRKAAAVIDKGV